MKNVHSTKKLIFTFWNWAKIQYLSLGSEVSHAIPKPKLIHPKMKKMDNQNCWFIERPPLSQLIEDKDFLAVISKFWSAHVSKISKPPKTEKTDFKIAFSRKLLENCWWIERLECTINLNAHSFIEARLMQYKWIAMKGKKLNRIRARVPLTQTKDEQRIINYMIRLIEVWTTWYFLCKPQKSGWWRSRWNIIKMDIEDQLLRIMKEWW